MDQKTMATASGEVGRTVPVAKETTTPETPGSYHEFTGSESKAMDNPFKGRLEKLVMALGNKDEVKG